MQVTTGDLVVRGSLRPQLTMRVPGLPSTFLILRCDPQNAASLEGSDGSRGGVAQAGALVVRGSLRSHLTMRVLSGCPPSQRYIDEPRPDPGAKADHHHPQRRRNAR